MMNLLSLFLHNFIIIIYFKTIYVHSKCGKYPGGFSPVENQLSTIYYAFCNETTGKLDIRHCPLVDEQQQVFNKVLKKCVSLNARELNKRTPKSSHLGESCSSNIDCIDNMYCPYGTCACLVGYVGLPTAPICAKILNPGQVGCIHDVQCASVWPGTMCIRQTCTCPLGTANVYTNDGSVCVKQLGLDSAVCPLPENYFGTGMLDVLPEGKNRRKCKVGSIDPDNCATTDNGLNSIPQNDIYDCIPHSSEDASNGVCCPSRALICIMPKVSSRNVDNRAGNSNRYWYNSITGMCEPFLWDMFGNDGNGNNFQSYEHCQNYCGGICRRGSPIINQRQKTTDPVTSLKTCMAESDCQNSADKNKVKYSCKTFNGLSMCCPLRDFVCSSFGGRNYRMNQNEISYPDSGSEGSPSERYYWTGSQCESFTYKGRAGNWNNFLTKEDCLTFCGAGNACYQGTALKDHRGFAQQCNSTKMCPSSFECQKSICCPSKETICSQAKLMGQCNQIAVRYWFNEKTGDCEVFRYSGCGGNDNNFESYQTCLNFCESNKPTPKCTQGEAEKLQTGQYRTCPTPESRICGTNYECHFDGLMFACCPKKTLSCNLLKDYGTSCGPETVRWYYDFNLNFCLNFTYGGCDGNDNNFKSELECLNYCQLLQSNVTSATTPVPLYANNTVTTAPPAGTVNTTKSLQQIITLRNGSNLRCPFANQKPYYASGANEPLICHPLLNQCPNGFACLNTGLSLFICCQPVNPIAEGQCPDGSKVALDSVTNLPVTCLDSLGTSCPISHICTYSVGYRNFYCCSTATARLSQGILYGSACPNSYQPYLSFWNTPVFCVPDSSGKGTCPELSSYCYNSPKYATTICCSKTT